MREKPLQKAPPAELAALNRTRAFSHINSTTAGLAALYHTSSSLPHPCFLTSNQSHPNPRQRKTQKLLLRNYFLSNFLISYRILPLLVYVLSLHYLFVYQYH